MLPPNLIINPPKSVPGTYREPNQPPLVPAQRLPHVRYHAMRGNETLADLAQMYYGNIREAIRIFNANRVGQLREDRSPGVLITVHDTPPTGTHLVIP